MRLASCRDPDPERVGAAAAQAGFRIDGDAGRAGEGAWGERDFGVDDVVAQAADELAQTLIDLV